jgi:hypothetical protein
LIEQLHSSAIWPQALATASIARLSFSLTSCELTNGSMIRTSMPRLDLALIWATTGAAIVAPCGLS